MGWASCGTDSQGRPIGYAHEGVCDEESCLELIDRGLAYACGDMHGTNDRQGNATCCDGYFCSKHLVLGGDGIFRCQKCHAEHGEESDEENEGA